MIKKYHYIDEQGNVSDALPLAALHKIDLPLTTKVLLEGAKQWITLAEASKSVQQQMVPSVPNVSAPALPPNKPLKVKPKELEVVKIVGIVCLGIVVIALYYNASLGLLRFGDEGGLNESNKEQSSTGAKLASNGVPKNALGSWNGSASAYGITAQILCNLDDHNNVSIVQTSSRGVHRKSGVYSFELLPSGTVLFTCTMNDGEIQKMTYYGHLSLDGSGIVLFKD